MIEILRTVADTEGAAEPTCGAAAQTSLGSATSTTEGPGGSPRGAGDGMDFPLRTTAGAPGGATGALAQVFIPVGPSGEATREPPLRSTNPRNAGPTRSQLPALFLIFL